MADEEAEEEMMELDSNLEEEAPLTEDFWEFTETNCGDALAGWLQSHSNEMGQNEKLRVPGGLKYQKS